MAYGGLERDCLARAAATAVATSTTSTTSTLAVSVTMASVTVAPVAVAVPEDRVADTSAEPARALVRLRVLGPGLAEEDAREEGLLAWGQASLGRLTVGVGHLEYGGCWCCCWC
jgi:hypothetical protein